MIKELANSSSPAAIAQEILIFLLVILLSTFLLRFTRNNSLVPHISVLKPLRTFTDALLLSISLAVVRGI